MDAPVANVEEAWEKVAADVLAFANREENRDRVASFLAKVLQSYAWPPQYERYFELWENHGFHITPVHFYQPIPDSRTLHDRLWDRQSELPGIDMGDGTQLKFLTSILPQFQQEYAQIPVRPTAQAHDFYLDNPHFSGTDALALYGMIRHFRPKRIVEVGGGYSSLLSAQALRTNGFGELVCIEPYPQEILQVGFPGLAKLIETKVQDVGLEVFDALGSEDILFIDSSHVVRVGGDVNFLFLEVLPRLRNGVVVHVHDIYLPHPGRRDWVMERRRFWNEQDLLQSFLIGNRQFEVLLANTYVASKYPDQLRAAFPSSPWWGGGSFWMRRKTD